MTDFFIEHSLYLVLSIALIIWFGLFYYMNKIDRNIKKLEKETESLK